MKTLLITAMILFASCSRYDCQYEFDVHGLDGRARDVFDEDTVYIGTIEGATDHTLCSSSRKVLVATNYYRIPYVECYIEDGAYYQLTTGNVLDRY